MGRRTGERGDCRAARPWRLFLLVAVVAIGTSACASSGRSARGARVTVVERDFHISVSPSTVRAGTVTLHIANTGPSTHEVNVDRTTLASGGLPLRANGLQANEDSARLTPIDSVSLPLHTSQDLTVQLTPGRYVLFCNLEGHYLGGMHVELDVTP
jgi:uncharacterized cupredoxin-like copper-binding protein